MEAPRQNTAPMDFFERQDQARRHTKWLEIYFALAVVTLVAMTYLAVAGFLQFHDWKSSHSFWNPKLCALVSGGTLLFIFCASAYKTMQLSSGGRAVAELLGGQPIPANTTDLDERKLLNVVEEMAIASGTPVPRVYVLPHERTINAFAAGHSTRDMVICATRGCLKRLTRDELQGVIGHEFSHILNGDMRLNLRLMGLTFGILCLALFGRILFQIRGRRTPLPILGLALMAIGWGGVFFAKLIKSAISREREFLADASAVQFTRNPEGLANALKKVGGSGSQIDDANAEDASHMFFADGLSESFFGAFATHPPLKDRIRALDPAWDGHFIQSTPSPEETPPPPRVVERTGAPAANALQTGTAAVLLQSTGSPTPTHLEYAADLRAQMPATLTDATRDPMSAVALIYALILSKDDALRASQLQQLQTQAAPGISTEAARLFAEVAWFDRRAQLPLATLAMTALRQLSPAQFAQFEQNLQYLIESDGQIELFEFTLQKIVRHQLEPYFGKASKPVIQYYVLKPLAEECALVLSALARVGQTDPAEAEQAFQQGAAQLNLPGLQLAELAGCGVDKVETALNKLNQASPQLKKLILNACAATVAADGVIQQGEAELLRAIAETLDCPIPRFLTV